MPKSGPPSNTCGIYPHRTTPGSPSPSTSIRCQRVAKSQPSQREAVRCASQPDVLYVPRPDPSSTTEHRYTTSHHTKIIRLPPSIVCFGGGKFQASLRQSVSRSGCTDRIHTTPGSPPPLSMMIKGTMAGHSGLPHVNGLCARSQIPRWQNTITTAAAACAGGRFWQDGLAVATKGRPRGTPEGTTGTPKEGSEHELPVLAQVCPRRCTSMPSRRSWLAAWQVARGLREAKRCLHQRNQKFEASR